MITISRRPDGGYRLETEQVVPCAREEVFAFFADAGNLNVLTPPWLHFRILTPTPIAMGEGTLIDYTIRLHGIPMRWRTRISAWEPGRRFVDEQARGPFLQWVHEHTFEDVPGGTRCRDRVNYRVPLGALAHGLLVRRDNLRIFAYRREQMEARFGAVPSSS
jgi:ligand-binding SRPBCC domain-containing protein